MAPRSLDVAWLSGPVSELAERVRRERQGDLEPGRGAHGVVLLHEDPRPACKSGCPWVPEIVSPLCDLRVFVDKAAESIASMDTVVVCGDEGSGLGGWVRIPLFERSVWSVSVAVLGVLVDDEA